MPYQHYCVLRGVRAFGRSGKFPPDAAKWGDFVTASAAAAFSFSMIFAMTASRLRSKTPRFSITNLCDRRNPSR